MKRKSFFAGLVLGVIVCAAGFTASARADSIIFSNFAPGYTYNPSGFAVSGADSSLGLVSSAMGFVSPGGRVDLTEIIAGLSWFSGVNGVIMSLHIDDAGIPGASLASWSFGNLPPATSSPSTVTQNMTFASGAIILQPFQTYWIVADPIAPLSNLAWGQNLTGAFSLAGQNVDGVWHVGHSVAGAFEVRATIVPEPSTLLLLCTGVLGVWRFGLPFKRHLTR